VEEDITTPTSAAHPAPLNLFGMIILTLSGVRYKGLFVREFYSFSTNKQIPVFTRHQILYDVHDNQPVKFILYQLNSIHSLVSFSFTIHCVPFRVGVSELKSSVQALRLNFCMNFPTLPHACYVSFFSESARISNHPNDILGIYKLQISTLRNFLQPRIASINFR
jgi:hypothetical protein